MSQECKVRKQRISSVSLLGQSEVDREKRKVALKGRQRPKRYGEWRAHCHPIQSMGSKSGSAISAAVRIGISVYRRRLLFGRAGGES